ncbi:ZIP family metal transporter [Cellvibrio sp. PSBB023]|jgi:ZIP family zinc transporter|uniref:ZIP family metal transporter n=1 Tax=Cellvibrio sp. PSBB023 TaxID=1945512 RepID=UPI00098F01CB|nr:ZIP family zinc transporter [Cellvibrio sp. PSBB023]AQT61359.1 ZIP family zinc transporter [Cellvibrio sp. PSBB023]
MPLWLEAGFWGFVASSALLIGALLGWFIRFSAKTVAYVMAFGSGILVAALSFELVGSSLEQVSILWIAGGFMAGALVFSLINHQLNLPAVKHRKRFQHQPPVASNTGMAIAAGTLLDGIPESIAIGLLVASGGKLSVATIAAIFISNIPEALSSTAGMRRGGRGGWFILRLWLGIAVCSGVFAVIGAVFFGSAPAHIKALVTCVAAGGIFAMVVETMIPEAFAETHEMSGLVAALGFVVAVALQALEA